MNETEPNDKLGDADIVTAGVPVSGAFTTSGDADWYAVTVASPGRLTFSLTSPPANIRAYMRLYNRHANDVYVYQYAINDGDDVLFTYDVAEPGMYYIRLTDRDNDTSEAAYTFSVDFTPVVDALEPNNRLGQAALIDAANFSGIFFPSGEADCYKIHADADSTLNFTIDPPDGMRPHLRLYGPHANDLYVYRSAVNPGETITLSYTAAEAGFYYLRVTDADNAAHLEAYAMSVAGGSPEYTPPLTPGTEETEDNDRFGRADPVSLGDEISGGIDEADDPDWYRFEVVHTGQMTVSLSSVPANLELRFRLYNSSGEHLQAAQPTSPGGLFALIYDITEPDTYYLLVEDLDSQAFSSTPYTFSSVLVEVADVYEPNDDYGDARSLSQINRINGYIFKTGDRDWFRIHAAVAGELRVVLSDLPENITPQIDVYNMSKEHLSGKTGTAGMDMELLYTVSQPGDYLVRVSEGGQNDESTQPYTLTIYGAVFATFAPTAHIDQIDPGSIVVGNSIAFSGSGMDTDGDIVAYSWRSNIDGELNSTAAFSTSALSMGTHTVYFQVQDDDGIWSTEVSEVVYVGSTVSDEVEDNGEIGLANEIAAGQPVNAKINAAGDADLFKIYISRPGRLTCTATNVPENLRLNLRYFGRHLNDLYIYNSAAQEGDNVSLAVNPVEPGFVYLRIHERDNDFNADFTYTLTPSFEEAVDPQEPNDSMLDAYTMSDDAVSGYIFPNGDHDWYRVWVDAGATLTATVTDTPSNLRPYIRFYDRNANDLYRYAYADNEGDNPPPVSYTFDQAGFVYVRVHDRDNDYNWTQMYQLTLSGAAPGYTPVETPVTAETEENGVLADADLVSPGTTVSGNMGATNDTDWYKFSVPSAGVVHTALEAVPQQMRTRIRLLRSDGGYVDVRDATNPGDLLSLDTPVTRPGTYRISFEDIDGHVSEAPYRFSTAFTAVPDVHEPNGDFGDAAVLQDRNRTQGWIFDRGDEDWFLVTCDAGEELKVTVTDVPDEIKPQIDIYNASGSWRAGKTATNNGQELTLTTITDRAAGYYFRVRHAGNNSYATQPYTLIVNGALFNSYTPLAVIDSVQPFQADAGATVTLTGHGEDADGDIIGYEWSSSLDGVLSTSRVGEVADLTPGRHTILFKVKDNDQNWSPETRTLLYYGVSAPQEEEPNDEIGSATFMEPGQSYSGTIDPGSELDFFRIPISQPCRLTVSADNPTGSQMRTHLAMYTSNADNAYVNVTANAAADPLTLSWNIDAPGDYFLKVDDADNAGGQYTISADLQAAPDPYEPNGEPKNAATVQVGDVVQGYIFAGGDHDWYKVTLDSPGTLHMSLTNMPLNLRGYIRVYGRNTEDLYVYSYANNDDLGENVFLDYNAAVAGTYFIRVHDRDNDFNAEDTYTFSTSFDAAPDVYEPNADFQNSTLLSQSSVRAYIFPGGDADWYRFYAETGAAIEMTVDETPLNLRPYLRLYDADRRDMYHYNYGEVEGEPVTLTYTAAYTGYYYLKVHDRDNDWSATQTYRLTVTGANLTYQPGTQTVTEETEPNNAFSASTHIGPGTATGIFGGDDDWYRFEVAERSRLTIALFPPASIQPVIRLYNDNGAEQASRYAENPGDFSQLYFDIAQPGMWYLRIYAENGAVSGESYQLQVSVDAVSDPYEPNPDYARATPLNFGEPVQAYLFPAGDRDWFRVEIDEPGVFRFRLENAPAEVQISMNLRDQNNSQLFDKQPLNAGTPLDETYAAAEAGAYYLYIYDRGDDDAATAPYTLTASFTPFVDALEPNGDFGRAAALDEKNQISAFIYPENDEDWYTFAVTEPGMLKIQTAESDGIDARVNLYTDSKSHLKEMTATMRGDDLLMTYEITQPDRYYLRIRDNGGNDFSRRPYVLTIQGGAFVEDAPVAAIDDMAPNPAIAGDTVILSGSGTDEDGSVVAYAWASDKDGALGGGSELVLSALSDGDHRISLRVQDDSGLWSGWVHKNLYVTDRIVVEAEYNDSFERSFPVPLATWVTGSIHPENETDYYKIYLEERGFLRTRVDAVPLGMRAAIAFYDAEGGNLYLSSEANNPGDGFAAEHFLAQGTYHVRVWDKKGGSYDRTYGIRFDATPAPDIHEPNDDPASATPIPADSVISDARICRQGDTDWYRITVDKPGKLALNVTQAPSEMRSYIRIYNVHLDDTYVYQYAYHDGEDVFLDFEITSPGTYYIRVHDRDNEAHTAPYTFTSMFTPVVDPYEENNDPGHAALMPQTDVEGFIFPHSDSDWYRIYAVRDDVLSLTVTDAPSAMKTQVRVFNRDMGDTYVYQYANNDGDDVVLDYTVPEDGVYSIRVSDNNGRYHVTPYRLSVSGGTVNYDPPFNPTNTNLEQEPNGSFSEATDIDLDTDISGTVDPGDDNDWYRFYVNSPGILTLSHTGIPGTIKSEMWVYNASGTQIGYRITTETGVDNILENFPVNEAGYYRVRLRDNTGTGSTSAYTLRVSHQPVVDGHEPNGGFGSATPLGQGSVEGRLFDQDDEDWYRIHVRDAASIAISLDEVPEGLRPRLRLYDANKTHLHEYVNTNPGVGGADVIVHDAPAPGFYFIRVYDEDNGFSAGTYTLSITGADFSAAPLLSPIGDRTIDETVAYAFTVNATDPDNPMDLEFSAGGLPPGAAFDPLTRIFSWTPERGQRGTYSGVHFEVSDGTYTDSEDITITVNALSRAPELTPIGGRSVPVGETLTFQVSATDPDDGDTLTYSAASLPTGATFEGDTFSWTPSESQVRLYENILFEVTDGTWTDFEYIDIDVTASVPSVTTGDISNITETGADAEGSVTASGGLAVTERGVVYATHETPTVDDLKTPADAGGTGTFSVTLSGLSTGTPYYVRAYAVNGAGTGYGEQKTFTTSAASAPLIQVTPDAHDFGAVIKQSESAEQGFAITNEGSAALVIDTITMTGDSAAEFQIRNDLCSGETLAPTEICSVKVVFSPVTTGMKIGYLSIPFNGPNTPEHQVELTGEGIPVPGDVNDDGRVDLNDAVLAIQASVGVQMQPDTVYPGADVNGDARIGMPEALYILKWISSTGDPM